MPTLEAQGRLAALALALRDVCMESLATIGIVPDAYLYPGLPPVEVGEAPCPGMLAVYVPNISRLQTNLGTGPLASVGQQGIARAPMARFTVIHAMCVDVWGADATSLPDIDSLNEQAIVHMTAGWALSNGVWHAIRKGGLVPGCSNWGVSDLTPLAVSGQSAGWTFDVQAQLDGYDPFVS